MTPKMQKALLALLSEPTKEKAAAKAGITSKTLRKFLDDPEFQAAYRAASSEMVGDAVRQAQKTLSPALTTLEEIMKDDDQNGQIRVSAVDDEARRRAQDDLAFGRISSQQFGQAVAQYAEKLTQEAKRERVYAADINRQIREAMREARHA